MRESRRLGGVGTGCIIWLCLGPSARRADRGLLRCSRHGAVGEQAVVTDAVEAAWQDVDQEAADELGVASVMTLFRSRPSTR